MFTLYRIGLYSVSKVAPVQCEQKVMFCCGAEIVPKRSQCEQKPYPSYNVQRSLLISKDHLPKRGSVAISAPIKVFRLDSDRFKNLSDTERSTFNSGAVLFRSRKCFESSVSSVNRSPAPYTFCDAPFHYPVQCEHSHSNQPSLWFHFRIKKVPFRFCVRSWQEAVHRAFFAVNLSNKYIKHATLHYRRIFRTCVSLGTLK